MFADPRYTDPDFMQRKDLQDEVHEALDELTEYVRRLVPHHEQEEEMIYHQRCLSMWGYCPIVLSFLRKQKAHLLKKYHKRVQIDKTIALAKSGGGNDLEKWAFVTIGFDDKKYKPEDYLGIMTAGLEKLKKRTFHTEFHAVLEKHRRADDGKIYIHHHIHALMKTEAPKSKILQYCHEIFKNNIAGKNFIDIKTHKDNVGSYAQKLEYIEGNKQESKLECVELDRQWRGSA